MSGRTTLVACLLVGLTTALAVAAKNEIEPPPDGKAVVYIGRMTGFVGRARPFHFFEGENYLARIKGKNFIRYVCDPGEHLFWVAAENRSFVKAELEAGRSYALFARLQMGTWSARAELQPITDGSEAWEEFRKLIVGKKPQKIDRAYIAKWEAGHPDYVRTALDEWKAAGEPALEMLEDEYFR